MTRMTTSDDDEPREAAPARTLRSTPQLWPLCLGLAFAAASLTPSLVPRPPLLQDALEERRATGSAPGS